MMKYSTYTWDLVRALQSAWAASSKTPATFIDSISTSNYPEKAKNPEMRFNSQPIVSNCLVSTYTETRAKRGRLGTQS